MRIVKHHCGFKESVDMRRSLPLITVRPEMICTQRIYCDEQKIQPRRRRLGGGVIFVGFGPTSSKSDQGTDHIDLQRGKQRYFQDGALWRRSGWIDELVPMNYERSVEKFRGHLTSHLAATTRQTLIGGVGVYLIDNPGTLTRQINSLRRSGARGYSLFGYANFFGSPSHESARNAAAIRKRRNFCIELKSINRI